MSVFGHYADYYDLLYRDKDYAGEAEFVQRLLERHAPRCGALLEFGSGTGRHAIEFARRGYSVSGVDRSARMVARACASYRRLPPKLRDRLEIRRGDVTAYSAPHGFDAVISLFHVINYQLTDRALQGMFRAARAALNPGGIFIFDFWYGPGVLADPPAVRVRRVSAPNVKLTRLAEPAFDSKRNVVDVNFTLFVTRTRTGQVRAFEEKHSMRILYLAQIKRLARLARFRVVATGEWLTRKPLSARSWLGHAVLRAVERA